MAITYLDDEPTPSASGKSITYLDSEIPWSEVPGNALENAKRIVTSLPQTAEAIGKGALAVGSLPSDLVSYPVQKLMGQQDTALSRDAGTLGNLVVGGGKGLGEEALKYKHPIEQFKQNPIDTAIDIGSVVAPFLAPEAETLEAGTNEAALRASRFAQEKAVKSLEGVMGQVRQMGPESAREMGQFALDKGIVSPLTPSSLGMERKLGGLLGETGEDIGAARAAGDVAGGAPTATDLMAKAKAELGPDYASGMKVGEQRSLGNAIDEIAKIKGPSFQNIADKATEMNQYASANKMLQAPGATTDVANFLSRENNEALQKALTPEQFSAYKQALSDYGSLRDIQKFFVRGEARGLAGRGQGPLTNLYHGISDTIGNKSMAAGADTVAKMLQSPAVAKVLPVLSAAAKAGPAALETTHYMLQKNDPEYAATTQNMAGQVDDRSTKQVPPDNDTQGVFSGVSTILRNLSMHPDLAPYMSIFKQGDSNPNSITTNHFILMQKDPNYNKAYSQATEGQGMP